MGSDCRTYEDSKKQVSDDTRIASGHGVGDIWRDDSRRSVVEGLSYGCLGRKKNRVHKKEDVDSLELLKILFALQERGGAAPEAKCREVPVTPITS